MIYYNYLHIRLLPKGCNRVKKSRKEDGNSLLQTKITYDRYLIISMNSYIIFTMSKLFFSTGTFKKRRVYLFLINEVF